MRALLALVLTTLALQAAAPVPPYKPSQFSTNPPGAILTDTTTWSNAAALYPLTIQTGVLQVLDPANVFINVKSFAAAGNGVVDDTASIQSALDLCASLPGAKLLFPPTPLSYYRITGSLVVTNGVQLIGKGAVIHATGLSPATPMLTLSNFNGGTIDGLRFESDQTNLPVPAIAISGNSADLNNVTLHDNTFVSTRVSIQGGPASTPSLTNLVVANNLFVGDFSGLTLLTGVGNVLTVGGYRGMSITHNRWAYRGEEGQLYMNAHCTDVTIDGNSFVNTATSSGVGRVLTCLGAANMSVANNAFQTTNYPGLVYIAAFYNTVRALTVTGNSFSTSWGVPPGQIIQMHGAGTMTDVTITGNSFGTVSGIPFIIVDSGATVGFLSITGNQGTTDQPAATIIDGTVNNLLDVNNFLVGP